jgi:hypothetical protein
MVLLIVGTALNPKFTHELTGRNGFILAGSPGCRTNNGRLPWHVETVRVVLSANCTEVGHSSLDSCDCHCASVLVIARPMSEYSEKMVKKLHICHKCPISSLNRISVQYPDKDKWLPTGSERSC